MLEQGVLDEVRAFPAWSKPAGQAIGAAQLRAYLAGDLGLEDATVSAVTATRQFAKRQRTWFRNKMSDWRRVDAAAPDLAGL